MSLHGTSWCYPASSCSISPIGLPAELPLIATHNQLPTHAEVQRCRDACPTHRSQRIRVTNFGKGIVTMHSMHSVASRWRFFISVPEG